MPEPTLLAMFAGTLVAGGCFLVMAGSGRRTVRMADAFAGLDGTASVGVAAEEPALTGDSWLERLGARAYSRLHLPVGENTRRLLRLHDRSIGDFMAEKLVLAAAGLLTPALLAVANAAMGAPVGPSAPVAGLVLAAAGWAWPDISLRRTAHRARYDADEALLTLFDLVILERMANRSASQALQSAASVSDVPVFRRVRGVMVQARLEQRQPWSGLRRLAAELRLPALADLADIMQLDDQGASLTEALAARVEELRDAHLAAEGAEAHEANERMTLWMALPVMLFGLAFIAPPLMGLAGVG